jgi:hypothetical protein
MNPEPWNLPTPIAELAKCCSNKYIEKQWDLNKLEATV